MVCVDFFEKRTYRTDELVQEIDSYYSNSFSSKWGNCRTFYCATSPGRGYSGEIASFRVDSRPRKELRLNFSRLRPQTVYSIIGKLIIEKKIILIFVNRKINLIFLAAFLSLYKRAKVEVDKQFCSSDADEQEFLTPQKVNLYFNNLEYLIFVVNFVVAC